MTPRRFPLPLVTLGLTAGAVAGTATGCTPSIVGEWSMTELERNGEDYSEYFEGYSETYEDDGCIYTYSISTIVKLTVENDKGELEAEFTTGYTGSYTNSCDPAENYTESYTYDYDTDIEKGDDGVWEIEIDDLDWKLECTVDGDELMCEGEYEDEDIEVVFERG